MNLEGHGSWGLSSSRSMVEHVGNSVFRTPVDLRKLLLAPGIVCDRCPHRVRRCADAEAGLAQACEERMD